MSSDARVNPADIADALTRAPFTYDDGATQVFTPDGNTTFTENGLASTGEWGVDDEGSFWSFWPPVHRATYNLAWISEAGTVVGVRFTEIGGGDTFNGRYTSARA